MTLGEISTSDPSLPLDGHLPFPIPVYEEERQQDIAHRESFKPTELTLDRCKNWLAGQIDPTQGSFFSDAQGLAVWDQLDLYIRDGTKASPGKKAPIGSVQVPWQLFHRKGCSSDVRVWQVFSHEVEGSTKYGLRLYLEPGAGQDDPARLVRLEEYSFVVPQRTRRTQPKVQRVAAA